MEEKYSRRLKALHIVLMCAGSIKKWGVIVFSLYTYIVYIYTSKQKVSIIFNGRELFTWPYIVGGRCYFRVGE